jgi:subtilisin-like proprotein convertase family protein
MYLNITFQKQIKLLSKLSFVLLFMTAFSFSLKAQTYVNGNLGTGVVNKAGVTAPAGLQWHEMQNNIGDNTTACAALAFNSSGNFILSDNFVVPVGQTWTITGASFYGIQLNASPVSAVGVQIRNGSPLSGGTVIYGNLATNVYTTTSPANVKVSTSSANPTTAPFTVGTQEVSEIKTAFSTVLTAGTYWIAWQVTAIPSGTLNVSYYSPFSQVVGARTQAGYNAVISNTGTWSALTDAGTPAGQPPVATDLCFKINYTSTGGTACATPAPGNTLSTQTTPVCPGIPFNLSLQNQTAGVGVTYQWQSASTLGGTYTSILGATNNTLTYSISPANPSTFYRCNVTCGASTVPSTPVEIVKSGSCYCISSATSTDDEEILNVTVSTLNNTSDCSSVGPGPGSVNKQYSNYTSGVGAPAAPDLIQGANNPFSVQIGTCLGNWSNSLAIWIDLNKDGAFTANERVFVSPATTVGPHFEVGNLAIPATALLGVTRMRVVNVETAPANITACGTYLWGETEDYNVNIVPCVPVAITTQPANVSATCGSNTTFTVAASGSLPAYQWQYRVNATSPWITLTNTAPYSGVTTNTLTITNVGPLLGGYQYRALFSGGCTSTDFTNFGTLTVNPIVAVVNPASATLCQGGVQQLTITNIASPSPGSSVVNSATLNLNVLDNNPAGVNNSITMPALPVGATVVGIRVKLNVASTWVGDLNVNLKAPNNTIINLSHNLSVTNGNAGGGGSFVNTVIGSAFTTPLHTTASADNPHTGNYKADFGTTTVAGITPNITGFVPTLTSWNSLFGTPSGTWTIAIADIFPGGDVTTFQNWSLTIDYLLGAPATGLYSASSVPTGSTINTIFTNAACTTPYVAGTAINTVYVKPDTFGIFNYNVIVTDAACSSLPLSIPVSVFKSVGGTVTLKDTTICASKNAAFTLLGTLTGGPLFNHQYQVKTSASAPWTNVVNGGVYSGATTSTLTLTNVPASYSGYQYRDTISTGNACGGIASSIGKLTVNTTPVVTISAAPVTKLFPSLTSTLTAAVSSATAPITYQWLRNGTNVTGATNNTTVVTIDGLGVYTVAVKDANGCVGSAGTSTPASIAITDSVTNDRLFIYPSPNSGQFQVRWYTDLTNGTLVPALLNVYDSKGAKVFTGVYTIGNGYQPMRVDLGVHGKGIYRVDVLDSNGNRIKTGSVLVF